MSADNLFAFLTVIRFAEGTMGANGYRMLFGRGLFRSFADHPRKMITRRAGSKTISSTAAGAYQILAKTWDTCQAALHLPDFSPTSQDRAAVFLIKQRGAYRDILAGRFKTAIRKCNSEWASLPGSPYGQPVVNLDHLLAVYKSAGGTNIEE